MKLIPLRRLGTIKEEDEKDLRRKKNQTLAMDFEYKNEIAYQNLEATPSYILLKETILELSLKFKSIQLDFFLVKEAILRELIFTRRWIQRERFIVQRFIQSGQIPQDLQKRSL